MQPFIKTKTSCRPLALLPAALILTGTLTLVGCARSGFIKVHREESGPEHRSVHTTEVRQPQGAISPAGLWIEEPAAPLPPVPAPQGQRAQDLSAEMLPAGQRQPTALAPSVATSRVGFTLRATTGAAQPSDQALAQLGWLPHAGIGLCVLGVLLIVAKAWVPLLPLELGAGVLILGIGIIALPMLLDRYLWLLLLAGIGFFAFNVWRLNKLESVRAALGLGPAEKKTTSPTI